MLPDFGLSGRNQSPVIWSFVFKKTANRSIKKIAVAEKLQGKNRVYSPWTE
jgi:hypothetical protein